MTCKTVKKNGKSVQQCSAKLVSGVVKFNAAAASAQATLSRGGVVYATGLQTNVGGRVRLKLTAVRKLARGRYMLTLVTRNGRHELRRSVPLTLG